MSRLPIHPFLIALVPALSMYAASPGSSDLAEMGMAAATALAVAGVLLALAAAGYRDLTKAAALASVLLIAFIVVDANYGVIDNWEVFGARPFRRRFFVPASYLVLAAFAVWLYRWRRSLA